jgi:four helix bundle protein
MRAEDGGQRAARDDNAINSYRDLRVWQAAMDLTVAVYRLTSLLPKSETYALASQMQRAAVSIASNIAEGHEREGTTEFLYHLSVAQGSLGELSTQIDLTVRLGYAKVEDVAACLERVSVVRPQLFALRNALRRK